MNKDSMTITKEQFDKAVIETSTEIMNDPKLVSGMGKVIISMTGMIFASQLRVNLFGESDDATEEKKED